MRNGIPPFLRDLPAAYQLHYHIGLATKGKQPLFQPAATRGVVEAVLSEVCQRNHYHLLEHNIADNGLYLLLSLRPEHSVSGAVKAIRGNVWAAMKDLGDPRPLWSRGLFVRSVGSASVQQIAGYLSSQLEHHGFDSSAFQPVSYEGNTSAMSVLRKSAHAVFEMNHQFVFVIERRECFLDPQVAQGLVTCLRKTAAQQDIVVWKMEIVPDHVHLLVGLKPSHVPTEVASRFLADSWEWLGERYAAALRFERLEDVWKLSYYVGSTGAATTAQVRAWLRKWGVG